ncbi:TPA: phage tail protein [Klebsiella pneumoniae]|nr:phage tail protein [Klebsiella pneumoniae]HBR3769528.1 phage tail protein [Klebsiella pneumoniae]
MSKTLYKAVLTSEGVRRFASAALSGVPVGFAEMAVGDGELTDHESRTGLVSERYRAPLNRVVIADQAENVIRTEMIMMPQVGGFWLREAALYDDEGECLAVADLPPSYKPLLDQGAGRLQSVNLWIAVSNTVDVELKADPSVILATVDEVNKVKNEAKDYTDQVVGDLDTSIQQVIADAITAARRDFWEEENPPGTVRFFAQNVDPNEKWPWSQWSYTGENKTIRVGKADGSNVGVTGGNDTVTIQKANLPAVQIGVNGETSELPARELTARGAGRHRHQAGMVAPGDAWDGDYVVGSDNDSHRTRNYTDWAEDHTHIVEEPAHRHTTTGKTDNLGDGQEINIVEAHTLLMCWARVA